MSYDQRMISFHDRLPDVAKKETKIITLPPGAIYGLPGGDYLFFESYCNRKLSKCDCRRVFLNVQHESRFLATIGYGWENLNFYSRWFGENNPFYNTDLIAAIKGPILELTVFRSEYSNQILQLFKTMLMNDTSFIEMLKRHYFLFKQKA